MKYTNWKRILSCLLIAAPWVVTAIIQKAAGALFFAPVLLCGHRLCLHITAIDPGNAKQSRKVLDLLLWIFPVISLFCALTFHLSVRSGGSSVMLVTADFLGILFLIIGNYLPKCRRNSTIGIKIKWTLENEENWNATHRFGGIVWVACSLGFFLIGCLPLNWFVPGIAVLVVFMVLLPTAYSYRCYRRQLAAGTYTKDPVQMPKLGKAGIASAVIVVIAVTVLMFTGTVRTRLEADSLTVKSTYYPAVSIRYDEISQVELLPEYDGGVRTFGFSSARLAAGRYHSSQFGDYLRYTCSGSPGAIEIHVGETLYIISAENEAETRALYEQLRSRLGG